jgi:mannosyl-3-phosphoglycerate phosphatase
MRIVVFSDLDGTLLDHETYSHAPAGPALAELRRRGIPLVLASSKTAAEIAPLHAELGLGTAPAIVENGAGLFDPGQADAPGDGDYRRIRIALADLPDDLAGRFRGFGDMDAAEIAVVTGLPPDAAARARIRCCSEPGTWQGSADALRRFLDRLAAQGIAARQGGRFLTLSLGRTKADAMREVAQRLDAKVTIALGDAPNDAEMLGLADYGVVIRNDHAPPMPPFPAARQARIRHTAEPGPQGWNAAVLGLLKEIDGR